MKAIYRAVGAMVDHTPSGALTAGDVIVLGGMCGVVHTDIAAGALGAVNVGAGVYDVVKANEEQAANAALYWDADGNPQGGTAGTGCLTTSAGGNTFFGYAMALAGATAETVRVWKWPASAVTNTVHETLSAVIADPEDDGAIAITNSGTCSLVTVTIGGETRTLADPTFVGQQICLSLKTDGGNCVVTAASAINAAGNNTLTFADATDTIILTAVASGTDLVWRVTGNDGVALSTVG